MFLYKLPTPFLGLTHANLRFEVYPGESIYVLGEYGTLNEDGTFFAETAVIIAHRIIRGAEYKAFLDAQVEKGLPENQWGNFRQDDLAHWLDKYGLQKNTWDLTK